MKTKTIEIQDSCILNLTDHLGSVSPNIELFRRDDCWRPMMDDAVSEKHSDHAITWQGQWGGKHAYNHRPEDRIKPLDFDVWGCPNTLMPVNPLTYEMTFEVEPVSFDSIQAHKFRVEVKDTRSDTHPISRVVKVPVGIKIPYRKGTTAFGIREMYLEPEIVNMRVDDPAFQNEWFYLESELFANLTRHPMDGYGAEKSEWKNRFHSGAPMAVFREKEHEPWWALSGESDYGATICWQPDAVTVYTTLYLKPGESAEWQACLWRQQEEHPENVYLSATRPGGFYDMMNPVAFERKGVPEGPIAFINVNRPKESLDELRKVKPKMVILNYFYDHVACVANMYGEWKTYEGYHMTEEKLKALIAEIKSMGAKVGFYGTSVEQPETHKVIKSNDIVMDAWGRSFNAWEPGNWVIDAGNEDCADRMARAEAEFAQYYGLECVFIDRLDHMSVNHHPGRVGKAGDQRLENIPSVRLGMIELNRKRMEWHRKLNPSLYVGVNNTTQWAGGIRYSDFNLLEGGMDLEPPIFYLNAPFGIVHKQHYNVFFCDVDGDVVDHGIIQSDEQLSGFDLKRRGLFRDGVADGIIPQPYEDEIFVDPDSMFFKGWNNRELPDVEKLAVYKGRAFYGGKEWGEDEELIARAMEVARHAAFPVEKIWTKPESIPDGVRFSARRGVPGGFYAGVRNETDEVVELNFEVGGVVCAGSVGPGLAMAWFKENPEAELESLLF